MYTYIKINHIHKYICEHNYTYIHIDAISGTKINAYGSRWTS